MTTGRIAIIVPARTHSSRLDRKMFTEIQGRPAIWYVLHRMSAPRLPDMRVVCTSYHRDDDPIASFAQDSGWLVFRGSEEDVLQRYLAAATQFGVDLMVNVDGDDLFCHTGAVDAIIERYRTSHADLIRFDGLPFGGTPTGIKVEALRDVCSWKEESNTQGWAKYFTASGLYQVDTLVPEPGLHRPRYRMTLDYPEDVKFFEALVAELDRTYQGSLDLADAIAVLDAHPEIAAISDAVTERYWQRFEREHGSFVAPSKARTSLS